MMAVSQKHDGKNVEKIDTNQKKKQMMVAKLYEQKKLARM